MMPENIAVQIDYILFFYGLSFIILGFIAFSVRHHRLATLPWKYIAYFAFLHGLCNWMEILCEALEGQPLYPFFRLTRLLLQYAAFIALFEFGRNKLPKWIYIPIIPLSLLGLFYGFPQFNASMRYTLGFGGGMLSAARLARTASLQTKGKYALYTVAGATGLYSILVGLFPCECHFLLAGFINQTTFLNTFGVPVQLVKGVLAIAMSVGLWFYYQKKYSMVRYRFGGIIIGLILLVILFGGIATDSVGKFGEKEARESLLIQTRYAAASINTSRLSSLKLSESDIDDGNYQRLKAQLTSMKTSNPEVRFLYLMSVSGNTVRFIADSEPPDSPDYSPPGSVYNNYPPEILTSLSTPSGIVSKPYKDEWGEFTSAFVPIFNNDTGELVAVMGGDINTHLLETTINSHRLPVIVIILLTTVILLILFLGHQKMEEFQLVLSDAVEDLQKYKLAVENASDHIVITDDKGIILFANTAVQNITGFPLDSVLGTKAGILWGKLMDDKFYKTMWDTLLVDKKNFIGELTNHRKNGERYEAAVAISPVLDKRGKVKYLVGIERDITKLKEIDRMKSEFVSLVSHQLSTPMGIIKWNLEMLINGDFGQSTKEQQDAYVFLEETNSRMIELVKDLLNISRIESGRIIVNPHPTESKDLVSQVLEEVSLRQKENNTEIITSYQDSLPKINIDTNLARQVILNLLTNAIKYSPKSSRVEVSVYTEKENMIFNVKDYGYGIPLKDQSNVFTKFYRGENILSKDVEGSGLGLYLVKEILDSSGGKIWFESTENKGSSFWVSFPIKGVERKEGVVSII